MHYTGGLALTGDGLDIAFSRLSAINRLPHVSRCCSVQGLEPSKALRDLDHARSHYVLGQGENQDMQ